MKNIAALCLGLLLCACGGGGPAKCQPAPGAATAAPVAMRFDYAGAEAIVEALGRDSLSAADVDSLLRIHGVRAMVDNVSRFVPGVGVPQFRAEIRHFARTKRGGEHNDYFQLSDAWRERARVCALVAAIRADESRIVRATLARIEPYRPGTGPMRIDVYLVAGGVSDGFAFEDGRTSFYANLVRAEGDPHGLALNAGHEAYHVLQMAAQRRSGHFASWITDDGLPPVERLLMGTLVEGTANFVADPTRTAATGANIDRWRARYVRNAKPEQVAANFARFDRTLQGLRDGTTTWRAASDEGFSGDNPEFYFVGYEMAKAFDRHCGAACIGRLFDEAPVEFFRRYVALYRRHPEITARFSRETEEYLAAIR